MQRINGEPRERIKGSFPASLARQLREISQREGFTLERLIERLVRKALEAEAKQSA